MLLLVQYMPQDDAGAYHTALYSSPLHASGRLSFSLRHAVPLPGDAALLGSQVGGGSAIWLLARQGGSSCVYRTSREAADVALLPASSLDLEASPLIATPYSSVHQVRTAPWRALCTGSINGPVCTVPMHAYIYCAMHACMAIPPPG